MKTAVPIGSILRNIRKADEGIDQMRSPRLIPVRRSDPVNLFFGCIFDIEISAFSNKIR
jgi:hypothetical protein